MTITNRSGIYTLQIPPVIRQCSPAKTGDDAASEFAIGRCSILPEWYMGVRQHHNEDEGLVTDDDIGMMPIYIGVDGEENQGLCTGSENYWCVNSKGFRSRSSRQHLIS